MRDYIKNDEGGHINQTVGFQFVMFNYSEKDGSNMWEPKIRTTGTIEANASPPRCFGLGYKHTYELEISMEGSRNLL